LSGASGGGERTAAGDGNEPVGAVGPLSGAGGDGGKVDAGGASATDAGAGAGGEGALEWCGNSQDDDGDDFVDEGCAPPVNDSCAGAIELALPSGGRRDPMDGATRAADGCGSGAELWYRVTLPGRTIFYADTFGSEFSTAVSLRESCAAEPLHCSASGACSTGNQALATELGAGTYYVAVHASSVATPRGNLKLNWGTLAPPNGQATAITGSGVYQGTTAGTSSVRPKNCSGGAGPEDLFYFTLCPGVFIMQNLNGCRSTYETTLYVKQGNGGEVVCGDSDCTDPAIPAQPMYGPGLFGVYVDGRYTTGKGDYTATIVWSGGSF